MAEALNLKRMQGEGIRNPNADVAEEAPNAADRVKKLAEDFVSRQREADGGTLLEAA